MNLFINGEEKTLDGALSVGQLMALLRVDPQQCAVEINGVIVPRSRHAQQQVDDGDRVEIVRFIGGG